jgi:hypothetical protein
VKDTAGNYSAVWSSDLFTPTQADTTAPVLSAGSVSAYENTADGTTATVNFTSDEAGTYYVVVYLSGTEDPADGAAVETAYNGGVTGDVKAAATGAAAANTTVNASVTGLTKGTAYKAHVTVKDAAGNYSAVWTSEAFTPIQDTTAPVLSERSVTDYADTADGATATVNFTSNEAGTYWVVVYASDTAAPTDGAALFAAYDGASVKATGAAAANSAVNASITGLVAGTAYKAHVTVKDAAGNYSAVWSSEAFTPTQADTTAPWLWEGAVDMTSTDGTTVTVHCTSDEAGTYYVVVYASNIAVPADGAALFAAYDGASAKDTGNATANTAVNASITGLTRDTEYKAHVTVKDAAGNYSAVWSSEAFILASYNIGDTGPAGGLIFYVSTSGFSSNGVTCHYLEAAPANLGTYQWGGYHFNCGVTTGTAIGTGAANTAALTASGHSHTHPAAQACAGYSYGGYDDWFLPSIYELAQMYTNLKAQGLGGFSSSYYWSSSESASDYAWRKHFGTGYDGSAPEDYEYSVRAVRAF